MQVPPTSRLRSLTIMEDLGYEKMNTVIPEVEVQAGGNG